MWSYASTIFPTEEDFDSTDDSTGEHVLRNYFQLGVYIDRAIFTFKVIINNNTLEFMTYLNVC